MRRSTNRSRAARGNGRGPRPRLRGGLPPRLSVLAFLLAAAPLLLVARWRAPTASPGSSLAPPTLAPAPPSPPRRPLSAAEELPAAPSRRAVPLAAAAPAADPDEPTPPARTALPSRPARLEVLVLAPDGLRPAAGAHVELRQAPPPAREEEVRQVRADATGRVTVDAAEGPLAVVAWSETEVGGPLALTTAEGWNGTVEIVLQPAREVSGRITDATTGAPVAGATVAFWCVSALDVVRTAADGSFTHPRFLPTDLAQQVRVEAPGYGPCVRYLHVDRDGAWEFPAATAEGRTVGAATGTPWIEIELHPALQVHGRVVNAAGKPIPGARVSAEGYYHTLPGVASRDGAEARTTETGEFRIGGLRTDIGHALLVEAPGYAAWSTELEVEGGARRELGDVLLERERLVAGVVIDQEGLPVEDIVVELVPADAPAAESATGAHPPSPATEDLDAGVRVQGRFTRLRTSPDGAFLFEGLEAGAYLLRVVRGDVSLVERRLLPDTGEEVANVLLELPPDTFVLVGEVRDDHGPVAGARVEVRRSGAIGTVVTDARGRFRVAGLDARAAYDVHATAPDAKGDVRRAHAAIWAFERPVLRLGSAAQENLALAER